MGIWFRSIHLQDGESEQISAVANWLRVNRSIGGKLTVTSERLIFTANRLDAATGADDIDVALQQLKAVRINSGGITAARRRGLSALTHAQLEVETNSGDHLIISVADPNAFVVKIDQLRA